MTDMYMEQRASKKKYLIPLVVLLLCAVSLTGAGYAYSSTVTFDGAAVDSDDLTIDNPVYVNTADAGNEYIITQDHNKSNVKFGEPEYKSHMNAGKYATHAITADLVWPDENEVASATVTLEVAGYKIGETYYTAAEAATAELSIKSAVPNAENIKIALGTLIVVTPADAVTVTSTDSTVSINATYSVGSAGATINNVKASDLVDALNTVTVVFKLTMTPVSA